MAIGVQLRVAGRLFVETVFSIAQHGKLSFEVSLSDDIRQT